MHKKTAVILGLIVALTMVLTACTTPTAPPPQVIKETVVVKETNVVTVKETSIVKETSVVEVTKAAGEKGVVEFSGFYPKDAPYGRFMYDLGFRLEAENPECYFVYTEAPGIEGQKAMTLRIQEGDPPTLGCGASPGAPGGGEFVKAGLVYDLTADMETPPYGATEGKWFDTFSVAAQTLMSDFPGGGKLLVPYEPTNWVLWYNTAIYEQYGLSAPKTWDDLMANCEAIKNGSGGDISCIGGGGYPGYVTYWWHALVHGMTGDTKSLWFGPNLDDPSAAIRFDGEVALSAAKLLKDAVDKEYTGPGFLAGDFTANQTVYFQGKAAHLYVGTWLMGEMADVIPKTFKQLTTFFPSVAGGKGTWEWISGTINSYAVCNPGAKSKPTFSTECTVKYLKLFTSLEVATSFVNVQNTFSAVKGAPGPAAIPGGTEIMANMKEWTPNLDNLYSWCPEVYSVVTDELIKYLDGTQSLEDFGANAEQLAEESWGRCKETLSK